MLITYQETLGLAAAVAFLPQREGDSHAPTVVDKTAENKL